MALVVGTNCGFVTEAPTTDPSASSTSVNSNSTISNKDTSPAGATKVTEIGYWVDATSTAGNFEVGIYDWDTENDRPGDLIGVSRTNARDTTINRWVRVSVDIAINENTDYGIAWQTDAGFWTNYQSLSGERRDNKDGQTTLPDTWGGTTTGTTYRALYAVWEEADPDVTIEPSALTMSTTATEPSFFIDITKGALGLTSTLKAPSLFIENAAVSGDILATLLAPTVTLVTPPPVVKVKLSGSIVGEDEEPLSKVEVEEKIIPTYLQNRAMFIRNRMDKTLRRLKSWGDGQV